MDRVAAPIVFLVLASSLLACDPGASLGREGEEFAGSCIWVSHDLLGETISWESRGFDIVSARAIVGIDPALAFAYKVSRPECNREPDGVWHLARAQSITDEQRHKITRLVRAGEG